MAPILRSGAGVSTSPRARRAVRFRGCQANIPRRVRRTSRPARNIKRTSGACPDGTPGAEAGIKTSKASDRPPAILREPELRALLHVVDADRTFAGRRDAAILRLFIDTGARRAEVANLRWTPADPDTNDVDLDAGLVRVLGKGRRERLLSIGMKTVKSLDRYLRLREDTPPPPRPGCGWGSRAG